VSPDRHKDRLIRRTFTHHAHQFCLDFLATVEYQVFFRREVVEHGLRRDVRGSGDVGHGHRIKTPFSEQARRYLDELATQFALLPPDRESVGLSWCSSIGENAPQQCVIELTMRFVS
jgi:hypothetical protein